MSIAIQMPALSPTMEEGTLTKWLVKVGDQVRSGDIMAEIETDKATMEFEAVDEGVIAEISVPEGTEGVKVGTVIATLAEEGEDPASVKGAAKAEPATATTPAPSPTPVRAEPVEAPAPTAERPSTSSGRAEAGSGDRVVASPLAKRIAADKGLDLRARQGVFFTRAVDDIFTIRHMRMLRRSMRGIHQKLVAAECASGVLTNFRMMIDKRRQIQ